MSNLVDLYKKSSKIHVVEAREIPKQETDFFDREHQVADGFTTGEKKGDPTQFTEKGLAAYDTEVADLTPPESFNPAEPLHRYTPKTPFFSPGAPKE